MRFLIQAIKIGAVIVLTALILISARSAYNFAKQSTAKPTGDPIAFEVSKNEPVDAIGKDLKAKGLITDTNLFRAYIFVNQKSKNLSEGSYLLRKGMSLAQIVDVLTGAAVSTTAADEQNVRIPEGVRMEQIPGILRDAGLGAAAADFPNVAKNGVWNYDFLKDRPAGASLEGYLFPDTYKFTKDVDANTVIKAMLDNYQVRWQTALGSQPAPVRGKTPKGVANMYQVLIIASIVEREAGSDRDRADIASVYYNRLNFTPVLPLQADPTVQYAVGNEATWWKKTLTQDDLNINSAYNTYPNPSNTKGALPPGPICSPSLKSIQAALNPSATEFLFFVAKNDDSGTHAFAKTNQEQEDNKRKYQTPKP